MASLPWELADPEELTRLMRQHHYTYRALADATRDVSKSAIQRLHRGQQASCSHDTASQIAAAFGVPVDDLFRPRERSQAATGP